MTKRKNRSVEAASPFRLRLNRNKTLYLLVLAFICIYIIVKFYLDFSQSLFVQHKDRVNFVVYGPKTTLYSLGIDDAGNYAIPFYPDLKTQVPGGYSYYRIGALGKLVLLEKKPELFQKTFSAITATFVDYYFYDNKDEVYYGGKSDEDTIVKPQWQQLLFMKSNANFLDRIYFIYLINRIQTNSVHDINYLPYKRLKDDTIFRNDNFLEKYIGVFYQKTYRSENLNVQIYYTNNEFYTTAELISNILNGNGIVVGDLSQNDTKSARCIVRESSLGTFSATAQSIASFFGCHLEKGDTEVYDILFVLGDLEETWQVN